MSSRFESWEHELNARHEVRSVGRRRFLASLGAIFAFATTKIEAEGATLPTFFVSASGDDDSDGLTPETPWATLQNVNSQVPIGSVVLFRRGDTFYGELALPRNCEVGAYGVGDMPVLTMFKMLNRSESWAEVATGVWKIDLGSPLTHDGFTATADANIGYLLVDGVVKPAKKDRLALLLAPWDFWCDSAANTLYVAASINPSELAVDIKAAPLGETKGAIIYCNEGHNRIHDLHITGTGGCGIFGAAVDVHVYDCLIDYIGGSYLPNYKDGTARYGNGINNNIGSKRWLIERNEITQVYDAAYSSQGDARGTSGTWEDLTIRDNYIHDCTQSFEFWSMGTNVEAGFKRILLEGNLCERAGFSDFSEVRPNQAVRVHLLTYDWQLSADITIRNNTFVDAFSAYTFQVVDPLGLVSRDNDIRLGAETRMQVQRPETVEDAAAWQEATGQEVGSTIRVWP